MNCSRTHIFLILISSFYIFLSFWLNATLSQMSPRHTIYRAEKATPGITQFEENVLGPGLVS